MINEANNDVCVSRISLFEIAIKLKIGGRITLTRGLEGLIQDCYTEAITILPITDEQLLAYDNIPFYADHRDPFDRLILAIALAEKMPLISADGHFSQYTDLIDLIW